MSIPFPAGFLWVLALARCVEAAPSVYFTPFNKAPIQHVSLHRSVPALCLFEAAGIPSWSLAELSLNRFSVDRSLTCSDVQSVCATAFPGCSACWQSPPPTPRLLFVWALCRVFTLITLLFKKKKKRNSNNDHKQKGGDLVILFKD